MEARSGGETNKSTKSEPNGARKERRPRGICVVKEASKHSMNGDYHLRMEEKPYRHFPVHELTVRDQKKKSYDHVIVYPSRHTGIPGEIRYA